MYSSVTNLVYNAQIDSGHLINFFSLMISAQIAGEMLILGYITALPESQILIQGFFSFPTQTTSPSSFNCNV